MFNSFQSMRVRDRKAMDKLTESINTFQHCLKVYRKKKKERNYNLFLSYSHLKSSVENITTVQICEISK